MNSEHIKGKLIVFSAPSGSGKTTVVRKLMEDPNLKLAFSISATTRPSRENETNGHDYFFLDPDTFRAKIAADEFLEWEEVYDDRFYGSLISETEKMLAEGKNVAFDIDIAGGFSIKKQYGKEALLLFLKPPSLEVLEERLRKRGTDSEADILTRLGKAEKELSFSDRYDVVIINDDLDVAVEQTRSVILSFLGRD